MNNASKMISVIIVTRDRLELLNRAMQSILSQQYELLEIIIIDNQSLTPLTLKISIPENVEIKIHRTNQFLSASATRNCGIELSKGEYVSFLDDDDYYLQDKLSILKNAFEQSKDIDMVYGNTRMIGLNGTSLGVCRGPAEIASVMLNRYIHLNAVLIKRSVLTEIKFDLNMTTYEDVDLMFRIVSKHKCVHVDQDVAVWNRDNRKDQLTSRNWTRSEKNWLILCRKFSRLIESNSAVANLYYKKMFILSAIKFNLINTIIFFIKYLRYAKLAYLFK
ncbi:MULTISPECIES: glycosyltransferase [Methylotenera]|uniref:glycosyltransferase n=1 Tax=Methylotenera TaxID=359407 RepID=UPI00035FDE73|nr:MULTISPECIES: glycosyltransferase [Methylotenera]